MAKFMMSIRVCGFTVMWPLVGCVSGCTQSKPAERVSQTSPILAEVLRYEVQQFTAEGPGAGDSGVCVAVRDAAGTSNPSQNIMRQLNRRVRPRSACGANAVTLVAGPIDWLRDDEVRVKGAQVRAAEGERPLAYRVIRENGRWVCVGPILSWDPL